VLSDFHFLIVPAGFTDFAKPVGTGPYRMTEYQPGVRSMAERAPNYWKDGRAHVDAVELTVINDATARLNALVSGRIHVMNRVDRKTAGLLARRQGLSLARASGGLHYCLLAAADRDPTRSKDVRLALKHALDREQMLKTLLQGYGTIGNDHPIPAHDPFFDASLPQRAYDPDKARFHLKQAGLDRLPITLHTSEAAFTEAVDAAVLFRETAARAGIDVEVRREPADGYYNTVWMNVPFCVSYWVNRPTADMMFSSAYKSTPPGTTRCGGTRSSTASCSRPAAPSTRPAARSSTARCSAWSTRTAAPSSPPSRTGSTRSARRSRASRPRRSWSWARSGWRSGSGCRRDTGFVRRWCPNVRSAVVPEPLSRP
jgi:peptide/nickel transport system substrate-binding protein